MVSLLERTVGAYGFKGALINGHSQGRYLDDEFFWPILQRAEALRQELAPWDIHVVLIEPASIHTEAVRMDRRFQVHG